MLSADLISVNNSDLDTSKEAKCKLASHYEKLATVRTYLGDSKHKANSWQLA